MLFDPGHIATDHEASDRGWHALYTRHHHEKAVAVTLKAKGFEVFLPLYSALSRWKDRTRIVMLQLFPCYVFLQGGLNRRLDVISTAGIHGFVSFAGTPASIPCDEINSIRRVVDQNIKIEPHPFIQCGDRVRVKAGPLEGVEGILIRKKNLTRLILSVEMLGRSAAVEVDASLVEKARVWDKFHMCRVVRDERSVFTQAR